MLKAGQAHIVALRVAPAIPQSLRPLQTIAANLWWSWRDDARDLFRKLDPELWEQSNHNPIQLLHNVEQSKLDTAAQDKEYAEAVRTCAEAMQQYLKDDGWFRRMHGTEAGDPLVAYFCSEFGIAECLQIYSGGLGALAGDHLKSASDLTVPLIGMGLLYRRGYFHQRLSPNGWQEETYPPIDFEQQPLEEAIDESTGEQLRVLIELPGRDVRVAVWKTQVGHVTLYLLDTDLTENAPNDRGITGSLYGGDVETRIQQELILGVGGVRALRALKIAPTVFHMNEGHSAFLALERIAQLRVEHGLDFDEALEATASQQVFTTHTPVPAGIDRFSPELVQKYLSHRLDDFGLDFDGLLALGREHPDNTDEFFSMAGLALRTSRFCNGVSKLHGRVSRAMWKNFWPDTPEPETPIGHVTNGVHAPTWQAPSIAALLGKDLEKADLHPYNTDAFERIITVNDEDLWRAHQSERRNLIEFANERIRAHCRARGADAEETAHATTALDPDALTIGFARRFASYKRATLMLRDGSRLRAMIEDEDRPVQLLVAGKAHPADSMGKELIQQIANVAAQGGRSSRIVFLEDYDLHVGRMLVRGCDLWLNTPRRGMEASGTSGMKAALNGVMNVSILDGWWDEAYEHELGFAIPHADNAADRDAMDTFENRSLLDLLEHRVLPEFYDRPEGRNSVPKAWVQRMKRCIAALGPQFNTNRMVAEYADRYYLPAHRAGQKLNRNGATEAKSLANRLRTLRNAWPDVAVQSMDANIDGPVTVGQSTPITAEVELGDLRPEDVHVQLYHGSLLPSGDLVDCATNDMTVEQDLGDGRWRFTTSFSPTGTGRLGFTVRVLPKDDRLVQPIVPGLIAWHDSAGIPRTGDAEAGQLIAASQSH